MSCQIRIKEKANDFTETDQKIADYFMSFSKDAALQSASEIGRKTQTSSSAVIRFIKKLNYNSLNEARLDLTITDEDFNKDNLIIDASDTLQSVSKKIQQCVERGVSNTLELMNFQNLGKAVDLLVKADTVYLCGVGASGIVAADFYQKLSRIHKRCVFHPDSNMQMTMSVHTAKNDVLLVYSYQGKTKQMITAAERAKKNGTPCVAVTKSEASPLSKLADVLLHVPACEPDLRLGAIQSRYAQFVISDILFAGVALDDFERTKQSLKKTRELINEFNDER